MVKLPTTNEPLHERGELTVMVASGAHSIAFTTAPGPPLLLVEALLVELVVVLVLVVLLVVLAEALLVELVVEVAEALAV